MRRFPLLGAEKVWSLAKRSLAPPLLLLPPLLLCVGIGLGIRLDSSQSRFGPKNYQRNDVLNYYVAPARSYLAGRDFVPTGPSNFIPPPLQGWFIVALKQWAPEMTYGAMRSVQAWIGAATILLAFWIGFLLGGRWVGLVAAVLVAFDPDLIRLVAILLAETNYFFLLFAFLGVLLAASQRRSPWIAGASGLLLGLAALAKPVAMLLCLLIPAYWLVRDRDRRGVAMSAALLVGFVLSVAPWLNRNYQRYGHFYGISTNGGIALAQSNHLALDSARTKYWAHLRKDDSWKDRRIDRRFSRMRDGYGKREWNQKDAAYTRHALRYMREHPLHFLRNYVRKLYNAFWYPLPREFSDWNARNYYRVSLAGLGLLGLVWFAVERWRRPEAVMLWVFAYFSGITALFHISLSGRVQLPLKVLLTFFAAWGMVRYATLAVGLFARSQATSAESATP
jgi:4-amino-4-deoxy-L-arabinose transferase-like glycosyltransferase